VASNHDLRHDTGCRLIRGNLEERWNVSKPPARFLRPTG